MILYIAGPMTGIVGFNYRSFYDAAVLLRDDGYSVINPCERDPAEVQIAAWSSDTGNWADLPYPVDQLLPEIIQQNVDDVMSCDGIALLPGWENSTGARMEVALAERISIPTLKVSTWLELTAVHHE